MDKEKVTAVLIAGGEGSRIKEAYPLVPKCLIELGGESLIERNIKSLVGSGFNEVYIITKNYTQEITTYAKEKFPDLDIRILEDKFLTGTGGGLIENVEEFNKTILVLMADLYHNFDLSKFIENHLSNKHDLSIVSHPTSHMKDSDLIEVDLDDRVKKIHDKNSHSNKIINNIAMAGIYAIESELLKKDSPTYNSINLKIDFTRDIIQSVLEQDRIVKIYHTPQYIKDAGTEHRIKEINNDIVNNYALSEENPRRPIVFLDRDGTINEEAGHINNYKKIKLKKGVAEGVKVLNEKGILVVVVTNQPVLARGECSFETMNEINSYVELKLNQNYGAYIDEFYVCPHYPQSGFEGEVRSLKVVCKCRKPGTIFFEKAINRFNPDTARMFVVGDSETDIVAGKKIRAKTILIGNNSIARMSDADFKVNDFESAVKIILNELP
jgi:mannose-1-phosphate guanylyltransferase/phosphomannomutase